MTNYGNPALKLPYSNTGADNTTRNRVQGLIDWVSVTFKSEQLGAVFSEVLQIKMRYFVKENTGLNGYTHSYQMGEKIKVFFHPEQDRMGIFLQLTGESCRYYESMLQAQKRTWSDFITDCIALEGNFTRIDIALDDHKPYLNLHKVWAKAKAGEVISKLRTAGYREDVALATLKSNGSTIYFGSKFSRQMFRFYHKGKEQLKTIKKELDLKYLDELYQDGQITEHDVHTIDLDANPYYEDIDMDYYERWNRYELVCRQENANNVASYLADNRPIGEIAVGVLNDYLRITVAGQDSNRSRWNTWRPWNSLTKEVGAINISMIPKEQTIYDKELWIRKSVSPTLKLFQTYLEEKGYDGQAFIQEIINSSNLSNKHLSFLERALKLKRFEIDMRNEENVILKKNSNV